MVYYFIEADRRHRIQILILAAIFLITFFGVMLPSNAQIVKAQRSGFTWISTENVEDKNYGSGYTMYSAASVSYTHLSQNGKNI